MRWEKLQGIFLMILVGLICYQAGYLVAGKERLATAARLQAQTQEALILAEQFESICGREIADAPKSK